MDGAVVTAHDWRLGAAVLVVGVIVRLLKSDTRIPIDIPPRWQPVLVLGLGQLYAVLQSVVDGAPWRQAAVDGLKVAFVSMGLFDLVVKAAFKGDSPWWLAWLLRPGDGRARQVAPPASPADEGPA
jgi:hypothetical protein